MRLLAWLYTVKVKRSKNALLSIEAVDLVIYDVKSVKILEMRSGEILLTLSLLKSTSETA